MYPPLNFYPLPTYTHWHTNLFSYLVGCTQPFIRAQTLYDFIRDGYLAQMPQTIGVALIFGNMILYDINHHKFLPPLNLYAFGGQELCLTYHVSGIAIGLRAFIEWMSKLLWSTFIFKTQNKSLLLPCEAGELLWLDKMMKSIKLD